MLLMILSLIVLIMQLPAIWLVLRYNLHMFQLNGYKNDEFLRWLKKNWNKQSSVLIPLVMGVIAWIFYNPVTVILYGVAVYVIIWYFAFLRRFHTKKKLVFTARVKRLSVTIVIIDLLLLGIIFAMGGIRTDNCLLGGTWCLISGIVIVLAPFVMLLGNIVNKPIEKAISGYYYNDAVKILRGMPDMKIIGITGSYGKTSVKYYLNTLLSEKYDVLITPGNFNTTLGVIRTIRENLKPTNEIFLCEMGARHVGDIKEICDLVHPDMGVIASIGPQHLETFFSMENIVSTKFELADAVRDKNTGCMFLNGDNEYIRAKGREYGSVVWYNTDTESGETSGGYHADNISVSSLGTEFDVHTPSGDTEHYRMRLIGAHNVINVVGAIAAAHELGMTYDELKIPVRRLESVPHRMEIKNYGSVTIIDDAYNSNPVGSKAAVETLAMFDGVRILVTPGMVELGESEEEYNYRFGTYAAECCDYIALVGPKHTAPIAKGIEDHGFTPGRCQVFENLPDAMNFARGISDAGHKYILLENDLPDNY